MRINNVTIWNFGSYEHQSFNLEGLSLIHGKTGSGKSTIMDAISWALFGETSKGGSSDDVVSWNSNGVTKVSIHLDYLEICRIRGKGKNDLYWNDDHTNQGRGKDTTETQNIINVKLDIDFETFCAGAYYNEFSPTANFFLAKAKERRELFEKLANLELPKRLALGVTEDKKLTKNQLTKLESNYSNLSGKNSQTIKHHNECVQAVINWDSKRRELEKQAQEFDLEREEKSSIIIDQIASLKAGLEEPESSITVACQMCKRAFPTEEHDKQHKIYNNTLNRIQRLESELFYASKQTNLYRVQLDATINPHTERIAELIEEMNSLSGEIRTLDKDITDCTKRISGLEELYELSSELRAHLLKSSIKSIEYNTNKNLQDYFDSEIRVEFNLTYSDNLDVTIQKSGNECNFKQLSKGQRQLLKLCFVVAVMEAVSERTGVHFDNLLFDEALDGYDSTLKIKAFRLFENLSLNRQSVTIIDHNEDLQQMFDKKYHVTIEDNKSVINES